MAPTSIGSFDPELADELAFELEPLPVDALAPPFESEPHAATDAARAEMVAAATTFRVMAESLSISRSSGGFVRAPQARWLSGPLIGVRGR
jgi:hypothetical protein